jgi:hypothetical protein
MEDYTAEFSFYREKFSGIYASRLCFCSPIVSDWHTSCHLLLFIQES